MDLSSIFFDDGGVLNDNSMRHDQWMELCAQYFQPRYGGMHQTWREANHQAIAILIDELDARIHDSQNLEFQKHQKLLDEIWINHMFDTVGVQRPPKKDYYRICRNVEEWITPQIQAAIDGIIPVIKVIHSLGYHLYTASGETSWTLHGYLSGMDLLDCFTTLYGPDLIGVMKGGNEFYKHMFSHAEVNPSQSLVIDDNPKMLRLADQLGAFTIQSCVLRDLEPGWKYYYRTPLELLELINRIIS
ncbi:MAG: HAD family hydrolase [Candidatus Heimdallarchaeota archaeon]